jgi:hypothetical protein
MEAFLKTTERGESRLCVRFPSKPCMELLAIIKYNGGRYRKAGSGERSCWYFPLQNASSLVADLGEDPLAALVATLLPDGDPAPPAAVAMATAVEAAEPAEEATVRPVKRQRRSGRLQPPQACFACLFEIKELNRTGHFVEGPMPHDDSCGF